jgi:hypothetical protein
LPFIIWGSKNAQQNVYGQIKMSWTKKCALKLQVCAELSLLSYRTQEVGKELPGGFKVADQISISTSKHVKPFSAFAAKRDTETLLCITGADDVMDIISCTDVARKPWLSVDASEKATFHSGFLDIMQTNVTPWLKSLTLEPSVTIVGHSLGGALAQLTALYLCQSGMRSKSNVAVYSFGTPAIGNEASRLLALNAGFGMVDVMAHQDPVPVMHKMVSDYVRWGSGTDQPQRNFILHDDGKMVGSKPEVDWGFNLLCWPKHSMHTYTRGIKVFVI